MKYEEFIASKQFVTQSAGFDANLKDYPLFDYQQAIVTWACHRGRAAIFADTGLGKTIMQLAWADQVSKKTGGNVLVLALWRFLNKPLMKAKSLALMSAVLIVLLIAAYTSPTTSNCTI